MKQSCPAWVNKCEVIAADLNGACFLHPENCSDSNLHTSKRRQYLWSLGVMWDMLCKLPHALFLPNLIL